MTKQSYKNHSKYYPAHHFLFYPLLLVFIVYGIYGYANHSDQHEIWICLISGFIFIGWLAFMLRQHYALGNQDRIIRLELRLRYFEITGERFEPLEMNFRFKQLAALRFASDNELPALIKRAIIEQLTSSDIKKSILKWKEDHMRV
jgi:Family of unknown function (DUF6526)